MKKIILILISITVYIYADFSRNMSTNIVTDNSTGLQWQDEVYTQAEKDASFNGYELGKAMYWESAVDYCENLTLGGYSDWRLPNIRVLSTIIDRTKYSPPMNEIFKNTVHSHISSTTTARWDPNNDTSSNDFFAWSIILTDFHGGTIAYANKLSSSFVRCVRNTIL